MDWLLELDRDLSQVFFGKQHGRPTVSRVAARAISRQTGWSVSGSSNAFHGLLVLGVLALFVRVVK